jgi:hypothetical protein
MKTLKEQYKEWKLENPDKDYQCDEIYEFLARFSRGDVYEIMEEYAALDKEVDSKREIPLQIESKDITCDICGCHPSVIIINENGTFCRKHLI